MAYVMTPQDRNDTWHAYRIVRISGDTATKRRLIKTASKRVLRMVEIMPEYLAKECLAQAWALTAEAVNKFRVGQIVASNQRGDRLTYKVTQVNDDDTIDVISNDHNWLSYPDQPARWFDAVEGL